MKLKLSLLWFVALVWLAWQTAAADRIRSPQQTDSFQYLPVLNTPVSYIAFDEVATGLIRPTVITHAGDARLFIAEKQGIIRILQNGILLSQPFLDIRDRVNSTDIEQGIESIAFPPDFATSRRFYVMYTNLAGHVHLSRFAVTPANPNLADPNSETVLLVVEQSSPIHNGADLAFGPADGYLYVGMGDGGSVNDPNNMGQNRLTLKGKILRLDVSGTAGYTIPPDNPFVNDPGTLDEIWALGLRNPWRMSFDRLTHDLWITDVGEESWEEINHQLANSPGGENYGWRCYEGLVPFNLDGCAPVSAFTLPVHTYAQAVGGTCAITGGYRYRGSQYPEFYGDYFFADFCAGDVWALVEDNGQWRADALTQFHGFISTFGEDAQGELYAADYFDGVIYRIRPFTP